MAPNSLQQHTSGAKVLAMKVTVCSFLALILCVVPLIAKEKPVVETPPADPSASVKTPDKRPEELAMVRYQPIIDRKPFGAAPVITIPTKAVNTESDIPRTSELRVLEVCAFTEAEDGALTVGLLNPKAGAVYYLAIGEQSYDGEFTVIGADYEKEGVQVRQGEYERWIYNASKPSSPSASRSSGSSIQSRSSSIRNTREAILERMRKRRSASQPKAKTVQYSEEQLKNQVSSDEMKKRLQEVQKNLIRSGGGQGPPLPVQLTVESDNQLVNEGVLPPR